MSQYFVRTQEDWEAIVADAAIGFSDYIFIEGPIVIDSSPANRLDIYIQRGGSITAISGTGNAYTLCGGTLSLTWSGVSGETIYTDTECDPEPMVTLKGWPEDEHPRLHSDMDVDVSVVRTTCSGVGDAVSEPLHYTWVGEALAQAGAPVLSVNLQSWDLLDALFPDNPHLWNTGKYLARFGRKGGANKRVEDLRKAITYLERAIKAEGRNVN